MDIWFTVSLSWSQYPNKEINQIRTTYWNFDSSNLLNLMTSPNDPAMDSHMSTEFDTSEEELPVSNDHYEIAKEWCWLGWVNHLKPTESLDDRNAKHQEKSETWEDNLWPQISRNRWVIHITCCVLVAKSLCVNVVSKMAQSKFCSRIHSPNNVQFQFDHQLSNSCNGS